jgi:hypothetical protein
VRDETDVSGAIRASDIMGVRKAGYSVRYYPGLIVKPRVDKKRSPARRPGRVL